jgi:NAD+-dependent secondary alcohol dehydrogenase Adh1
MNAARIFEYQEPLRVVDVPYPKIKGPCGVIVKIGGAGVCHTDVNIVQGLWRRLVTVSLPYTPGHENAGWVEEVGDEVRRFRKGDPVIVHPAVTDGVCNACRAGEDMYCENLQFPGLSQDGGFAEFLLTSERSLIALEGLKPADVAPLADAGLTAIRAVKKAAAKTHAGSYVAIVGIGGLGHIGLQILKHITPATILALDVEQAKLKMAENLGAHHGVDARKDPVGQVKAITKGKGADVVVDFVGMDETLKNDLQMLRKGGKLVVVGYAMKGHGGNVSIPAQDMIFSELTIEGSLVGSYKELEELVELARQGKVEVKTKKYTLDEVNDAIEDLKAGKVQGRATLVP